MSYDNILETKNKQYISINRGDNIIIIKLQGGLGNQLFQYAFARSLANDLKKELFIDISYFDHYKPQHAVYGLSPYNIKGIVGNYSLTKHTTMDIENNSLQVINYYKNGEPITTWGHFTGKKPEDIQIKTPAYFDGFYQQKMYFDNRLYMSEDFFKHNNDVIKSDLTYMAPLSATAQAIINDMDRFDSVALHVRHGDYTSIPDFGLCSQEYYQTAIDLISSKLTNPKFFVFSQDYDWVNENLKFDAPYTFVDYQENINIVGRGNAELLKIMSSCKHFIIANSTFSWWGSFLSENKEKIIIAPEPWFQSRRVLGVETIDNIKPITIPSNYNKYYQDSPTLIYQLDKDNFSIESLSTEFESNSLTLSDLSNESKIKLKNFKEIDDEYVYIMKISFESFNFDAIKMNYKRKTDPEKEIISTIYYYKDECITHFVILPNDIILNTLEFSLAMNNSNKKLILKELSIKKVINTI